MKIFKKTNYGVINISSIYNKYIPIVPDGAWVKCDYCGKILYKKYLENNYFICNNCGSNFRLSAYDRLKNSLGTDNIEYSKGYFRVAQEEGYYLYYSCNVRYKKYDI